MEPFLVLGDIVQEFNFLDDTRPFRTVECSSKTAYGCGPNGDAIVQGLTLLVRLGRADDPNNHPELCLRATDEVFHLVGSELDADKARRYGSLTRLCCRINTVDGDVMVLDVFTVPDFNGSQVSYYLVYDSAAASLSLLPPWPPGCRRVCSEHPLKVKAVGQDKYSLVLMAERSVCSSDKYTDPVLCLWSPGDDNGDRQRAWDLKARVGINGTTGNDPAFEAHVVFSCKGRAVWGDLAQGILYCDCSDLIDGDTEPVGFKHVMLPEECRTVYNKYDWDQEPVDVYRNMGCVGDSIWLVVIEPSPTSTCAGDTMVKVWTLDLPSGDEDWSLHREFRMQSVWELELFRAFGLPKTVPLYPILRQQDDCGIYMFLRQPYKGDGEDFAHLVCIDLSSRNKVRLRTRTRLAMPRMELPVVLDPGFFSPLKDPSVHSPGEDLPTSL